MALHLLGEIRRFGARPLVVLIHFHLRRAHEPELDCQPAVFEDDVRQRHDVLYARRRIAVEEARKVLAIQRKQIDS